MTGKTVKLTVGQAIVRYLINQYTIIDGNVISYLLEYLVFLVMVMLLACRKPLNKFRIVCLHGGVRMSNLWL